MMSWSHTISASGTVLWFLSTKKKVSGLTVALEPNLSKKGSKTLTGENDFLIFLKGF